MTTKNIKAIIFDLDGTLVNSLEDIADSANEAITKLGAPSHAVEAYRCFVGDGLAKLMERAMPDGSPRSALQESIEAFRSIYNNKWSNKTRPYPGIMDMLERLQQSGVNMAVLSNKPDNFTQKCVNLFFPKIDFNAIAGKKDDTPSKPDPLSTLKMLEVLEVHPAQSVFVGDSSVDIETGIGAGMNTIGVDWGFRTKSELEGAGADLVISSPQELIHYVSKH